MKQKLDAEKALQKQRLVLQIKMSREEKEQQRIKDIRAMGLDKKDARTVSGAELSGFLGGSI